PPPIGRPIANTQIYILDDRLEPVPIGVAGEIYIAGAGVARGYLNRPELTAERFLRDPFSSDPHARMYKSGDLGRWLPDGTIEYLGRNDHQVKIRGFRIEPGEIEAQLARHPAVKEAAVIAREDTPGDKRLVAYLTPRSDEPFDLDALRNHLKAALPEYMVPAAFVTLDALPLMPNGKLDRKALPAPDLAAFAARHYKAPEGPLEIALAQIWADLLHVERVGRHDSFFDLGGHSLLAVQALSRIEQRLGLRIALRELFEHASLQALALHLQAADSVAWAPMEPADRTGPLALSWSQQRLWFLQQLDARAGAAYHMSGALRLHGVLDRAALQSTLD
ncbi:MAG: AMP-binding protein, partial [Burkholderiales bacterium]|nr:AMP-binding protein [Burkholderiales bacterium]